MAVGFVTSFAGSTLVLGSITGFVALGVLPIVWVPVYRTLESVEDLAAPLVARIARAIAPATLLLAVEIFDLLATSIALFALFVDQAGAQVILISYLILVSVGPLILDIGEEYFANDLAQVAPLDTLKMNAAIYSAVGLFSGLLSRPVGSLLAAGPVALVLWINAALTVLGLGMRLRSVRFYRAATRREEATSYDHAAEPTDLGSETPKTTTAGGPKAFKGLILSPSSALLSPTVSLMLAFASGLVGTYLALWLAAGSPTRLAIGLVAAGLGSTFGPQLARRRGSTAPRVATEGLKVLTVAMLTALICAIAVSTLCRPGTPIATGGMSLALAVYSAGASGFLVLLSSHRQARLDKTAFARVIGWIHGASATGSLAGSWCGLALDAQHSPAWAATLAIAAISLVLLAVEQASRQSAADGIVASSAVTRH